MAFRWGILGLGSIAHSFALGLQSVPDAQLYAVGSRSLEKARTFSKKFGVPKYYASYQELVQDPDIDAVYIATPHPMHLADTQLVIRAGKAALCEKPFTVNAREALALVAESTSNNIFLMEAMWTRFTPVMARIRDLITAGEIGDIRLVEANFGFRADFDPHSRLFSPELGGGALLDVGVYPISLASMILGTPCSLTGLAQMGLTGVDEQSAYVLMYAGGAMAVLSSAVRTKTSQTATIYGTKGKISLDTPWWIPKKLTLHREGDEPQVIVPEFSGNGYNYEAEEVARCVNNGKIESDILKHSETIAIMETMDKLRAPWGLVYPREKQ